MKNKPLVGAALLTFVLGTGAAQANTTETVPGTLMNSVCAEATGEYRCLVDLRNGDFEAPIDSSDPYRWQFHAPRGVSAPYLGMTPDSRTLALPGKGATAWVDAPLPPVAAGSDQPKHTYTVRLRARGSGPMPAGVAVTLLMAGRELATVTHSVGWDWEPLDLKVDDVAVSTPGVMGVRIERMDNNTPTMLQVDDVRVVRTSSGLRGL